MKTQDDPIFFYGLSGFYMYVHDATVIDRTRKVLHGEVGKKLRKR